MDKVKIEFTDSTVLDGSVWFKGDIAMVNAEDAAKAVASGVAKLVKEAPEVAVAPKAEKAVRA